MEFNLILLKIILDISKAVLTLNKDILNNLCNSGKEI